MLIALLADIHGNLSALRRVLLHVRMAGADTIVCLGDIVGYGPHPEECIALVREHCGIVVRGNHDAGATGDLTPEDFSRDAKLAIEWTKERLSAESRTFLAGLPLLASDEHATYVHASPRYPERWDYLETLRDVRQTAGYFTTPLCCVGHTHRPMVMGLDGSENAVRPGVRYIVNPGSVGQPRDGNPDAAWALIDTDKPSVTVYRVPYEYSVTATAIREAGLPSHLARRIEIGV